METTQTTRPSLGRPGRATRVTARLRGRALDELLAHGADPGDGGLLAARADWLVSPGRRARLADAWLGALDHARETAVVVDPRVPLARESVLAAEPVIVQLADLVRGPSSVRAGTLARAWALLSDGTGPLFTGHGLRAQLTALVAEIDPATAP